MFRNEAEEFKIGDWVSGTTLEDERVIGYLEAVYAEGGLRVRVTQSDHADAVGRAADCLAAKVSKLPDYVPSGTEELRTLLDLSLQTQDRVWFEELSSRSGGRPQPAQALAEERAENSLDHTIAGLLSKRRGGSRLPRVSKD